MTTTDNPVRYTGGGDVHTITLAGVAYSLAELEATLIIGRDAMAALGQARAAEGRLAARVYELECEILPEAVADCERWMQRAYDAEQELAALRARLPVLEAAAGVD